MAMKAAASAATRISSLRSPGINKMSMPARIGVKTIMLRIGNCILHLKRLSMVCLEKHNHCSIDDIQNPGWPDPDPQHEDEQWSDDQHLPCVDLGKVPNPMFVERPMQHLLESLENIRTGEEQADHAEGGEQGKNWPGAAHDQELRHKPI